MEGTCKMNCVDALSKRYDEGLCEPVFRPFGHDQFIAFKCGIEFKDILDVTEWQDKIKNNEIIVSPGFGDFELGETSTTIFTDGCGVDYPEYSETPWTFMTPSTSDDYSDEDFWYTFKKAAAGYTIGYLNCEGMLYLNDEAVIAIKAADGGAINIFDPGLQMSLSNIPKWSEGQNGKGKAGIWKVEGKFIHKEVFRGVEIPGLSKVLDYVHTT